MNYDIESVTNWEALCRVAHGMMQDKGWWEEERPVLRLRLLIGSEISEALECLRDDQIDTWLRQDGKPEGFWVEVADALIRIADAVGGRAIVARDVSGLSWDQPMDLWRALDTMSYYLANQYYDATARTAFATAASHNHDIWATIRLKLRYNATRPHKHGRGA